MSTIRIIGIDPGIVISGFCILDFYKSKTKFNTIEIQLLVIITKGKTIPSSNSSLYYEQAISQINSFVEENIIMMPILVIGFYSNEDTSYGIVTTLEHLFG